MRHLLLLAIACSSAIGCSPNADSDAPKPGTELYAVAPETITEVLVSSGDHKLLAYRWSASEPFHLMIASRSKPAGEHCLAGDRFAGWLQSVSTARITREASPAVDRKAPGWTHVRLRDRSSLDPIDVQLHIPPSDTGPVVLAHGDKQFIVDMQAVVIRRAVLGCKDLGN